MPKKEEVITGLDIGSFSVKYVVVSSAKEGEFRLRKFGVRRLIETTEARLLEELTSIAGELEEKEVNVSVSGPSVVVRYISLPKMKEEELASLCMKAGLPADAWREGAQFQVYETQVFGEE